MVIDGNNVKLNFATTFSTYARYLLRDNGSSNHDLSIVVAAKWKNTEIGADLRQEFVFNDEKVQWVSTDNKRSYFANLSGINSKENLVMQLMIVTDCGVVVYSEEYPVTTAVE